MKISKSKQELARIISENGGWRDGAEYSAMDTNGMVCGYLSAPKWSTSLRKWVGSGRFRMFLSKTPAPNHQRTTLSSAEYFHLYPATDADGWIEWKGGERPVDEYCMVDYRMSATPYGYHLTNQACNLAWDGVEKPYCIIAYRLHKPERVEIADFNPAGDGVTDDTKAFHDAVNSMSKSKAIGDDETNLAAKEELEAMECKPSIEQLMQTYADRAHSLQLANEHLALCTKQVSEAMEALSAACKDAGFDISPITAKQEPELVITELRDLRVGDEVKASYRDIEHVTGMVIKIDIGDKNQPVYVSDGIKSLWATDWKFIRRP